MMESAISYTESRSPLPVSLAGRILLAALDTSCGGGKARRIALLAATYMSCSSRLSTNFCLASVTALLKVSNMLTTSSRVNRGVDDGGVGGGGDSDGAVTIRPRFSSSRRALAKGA